MSEEIQEGQIPRVEELDERQLERLTRNHLLISLVKGGMPLSAALERVASHYPELRYGARSAQKLIRRFKEQGYIALIDQRLKNRRGDLLFTSEVKKITLAIWYARPAAGPRAIWKKVVKYCGESGIAAPGYDVIKKFIAALPEHDRLVREGKIKVWDKQARPVVRFNLTTYSNERWQIDHTRLDIWVREWITGGWQVCEVWLTVILDAHSRSICGFVLSAKQPDAWTTALALRMAILPKKNPQWRNRGLAAVLQPDRGRDFMSNAVGASLAYLGIFRDPDPPYYPQRKGRVERFFRTLDTGCLRILPGHHRAVGVTLSAAEKHLAVLPTRAQLQREIERFIVKDYHRREHSETGRKPAEHWEETVRLRMPQSDDALDAMLLQSDKARSVRNTGVDFHLPGKSKKEDRGGRYWAPELAYHTKSEVRLSYNPEDLESVRVYSADTGEYICEAWLMGQENSRYGIADIKRTRSQFRRGLVERMKDYAEEIHEQDRRVARQAEWDEARVLADEMVAAEPAPEPEDGSDDVERMLAEFERRDKGL